MRVVKRENQISYEMGYERDPLKDEPLSTSMMETVVVEGDDDQYAGPGSESGFSKGKGGKIV